MSQDVYDMISVKIRNLNSGMFDRNLGRRIDFVCLLKLVAFSN